MSAIFFNLLINSAFSMMCGLLIISMVVWFFRVPPGRWKLFLYLIPFAKVVFDCLRGLPAESVLLAGIDPFTLPPKHQMLQIGAGMTYWGPVLNIILSVMDRSGQIYAASVGDYFSIWLHKNMGSAFLYSCLILVLLVSVSLVLRRLHFMKKFESERIDQRKYGVSLKKIKLRQRVVDVYSVETEISTPFTGGLFIPYICIPQRVIRQLTDGELRAVIGHELGHIQQFDLVLTVLIAVLGDFFWFVPGYRWLSRKIDEKRELVADQAAVERGENPLMLASALLKLQKGTDFSTSQNLCSAFVKGGHLIKDRILNLVEPEKQLKPRNGWRFLLVRIFLSTWIVATVLSATLGGNQRSMSFKNPEWAKKVIRTVESLL